MKRFDNCPHCNTSLIGDSILDTMISMYGIDKGTEYAKHYGSNTNFRLEIGIEIPGYYDGVVLYQCPRCDKRWKRADWVDDEYLAKDYKGE